MSVINATAIMADVADFLVGVAEDPEYLRDIVNQTLAQGGTTTNLARRGLPGETGPRAGFLVGGVVPSMVVKATKDGTPYWENATALGINDLARFIVRHAFLLMNGRRRTHYLGTWVDASTGDIHIDVSEFYGIFNRIAALDAAKARGELAIWDVAAEQSVPVTA